MDYTTFRITTKELTDVYLPVKDGLDKMKASIISNGFGQIISNYNGPRDFTVNSYHVWDSAYDSMVVKTADDSMTYTEAQVGPSLWGVSSEVGISFLYGNTKINGLTIIKYCNGCEDSNGLPLQIIDSYSKRFQYIKELNDTYKVETSYIFYDFNLPSNQRWFPAIYDTDNGDFIFKDYLGNTKDKTQVSTITSIPVLDIDTSLDDSKPPIDTICQEVWLGYSISKTDVCVATQSVYSYDETNSLLYNSDSCNKMFAPKGYYSDGATIFLWDGRTFKKIDICQTTKYTIEYCCNRQQMVVDGGEKGLTSGTFIYFDVEGYSSPCWYVVGTTDKKVNISGIINGETYDDCKTCAYDTRRFC